MQSTWSSAYLFCLTPAVILGYRRCLTSADRAGIGAGDEVVVLLSPEGPQRDDLEPDVTAAPAADPQAAAFFDSLAQFSRNAYLTWINATKRRPDVRAARITETVELLCAGVKERPDR